MTNDNPNPDIEQRPLVRAGQGGIPIDMPRMRARLVVVETIYHQPADGIPRSITPQYSRWLDSDETPYIRQIKVGEEWQKLDTAWITECSLLVIDNEEGKYARVQPTQAERDANNAKVVELGVHVAIGPGIASSVFQVSPGESFRGHPVSLENLWLRCRRGIAKVSVAIYPT